MTMSFKGGDIPLPAPPRPPARALAGVGVSLLLAVGCVAPVATGSRAPSIPPDRPQPLGPAGPDGARSPSARRRKPRPRPRPVAVSAPRARRPINFHNEGMSRGYDWKHRMKSGGKTFTPAEVREVADRMTSDYWNKGLRNNPAGQKKFKDAFYKAVMGR